MTLLCDRERLVTQVLAGQGWHALDDRPDLDVRHNATYRQGWVPLGVVVTTTSRRPRHVVGMMPILSAPSHTVELDLGPDDHVGVRTLLLTERAGR